MWSFPQCICFKLYKTAIIIFWKNHISVFVDFLILWILNYCLFIFKNIIIIFFWNNCTLWIINANLNQYAVKNFIIKKLIYLIALTNVISKVLLSCDSESDVYSDGYIMWPIFFICWCWVTGALLACVIQN